MRSSQLSSNISIQNGSAVVRGGVRATASVVVLWLGKRRSERQRFTHACAPTRQQNTETSCLEEQQKRRVSGPCAASSLTCGLLPQLLLLGTASRCAAVVVHRRRAVPTWPDAARPRVNRQPGCGTDCHLVCDSDSPAHRRAHVNIFQARISVGCSSGTRL